MSKSISDLKKRKNNMLRETIGAFIAPFLIPLLLLLYDFPPIVNTIFIIVVAIIGPIVGLLFLRVYLKAKREYMESIKPDELSNPAQKKFCPKCGAKVENTSLNYCVACKSEI